MKHHLWIRFCGGEQEDFNKEVSPEECPTWLREGMDYDLWGWRTFRVEKVTFSVTHPDDGSGLEGPQMDVYMVGYGPGLTDKDKIMLLKDKWEEG